jgi:hypothetical protein
MVYQLADNQNILLNNSTRKSPVADASSLPMTGNDAWDARITLDDLSINIRDWASWIVYSWGWAWLITASNWLTATGSNVELGGTLVANTAIDIDEFSFSVGGQIDPNFTGWLQVTDDLFGLGVVGAVLQTSDTSDNSSLIVSGDISAFGIGNAGEVASFMAYLPDIGDTSYYLANSDGLMNTSTDGAGAVISVFQTPISYAIFAENAALESAGITVEADTGIELLFGTAGALLIDGDEGTAGQVLTSNGAGVAPTWGVGIGNIYTADGSLTGAREVGGAGFSMSMIDFDGLTLSTGSGDIMSNSAQDNTLQAFRDVYVLADTSVNVSGTIATNINGGSVVIAPNNGDITLDTTSLPSDIRLNSGKDIFTEFEGVYVLRNNAGDSYFSLDITGDTYRFGDLTGAGLGLEMSIDNGTGIFSFLEKDNGQEMLRLHSTDFQYILGDVNDDKNSTKLDIHDDNQTVKLGGLNSGVWEFIDVANSTFTWGDVNGDVGGFQINFNSATGTLTTAETNILAGRTATPTMEVTGAGTYTIGDNTAGLYYDPGSLAATADITLPAAPIDGQEIEIYFGGTITTGTVVTALTILPNTGHTILGTLPTTALVSTVLKYKFRNSTNQWYQSIL